MANHYVNAVLGRNCYEELSSLFSCTNNPQKEITESYSAFSHMKHLFNQTGERLDDYINLHIGDGSTCRTGALFTFMSKSYNISIDPALNYNRMHDWIFQWGVKNLLPIKDMWQNAIPLVQNEFELKEYSKWDKSKLNLVMVHSHVNTAQVMNAFPSWKFAYVNPCCMKNKQLLSTQYMRENNVSCILAGPDNYIMSPENMVYIYRNDKKEN